MSTQRRSKKSGGKASLRPLIRAHFARPAEEDRRFSRAVLQTAVVPGLAGLVVSAAVVTGLDLRDGVSQLMAGTTLLIGAMLSLFVFILNLRIKVAESPTYAFRRGLHRVLGGMAADSLYLAAATAILTGQLILVASLPALRADSAQPWVAGVAAGTTVHIALTGAALVRRMFGLYFEFFAADFDPDLDTIPMADDELVERPVEGRRRRADR